MTYAVALARSLAGYPGYLHKVRALVLGVSVFLVTVMAMFSAAVPAFLQDTAHKLSELTPAVSERANPTFWFQAKEHDRLWNGHRIARLYLAGNQPDATAPPGLPRFPRPGEVFLSPGLRALAATDPVIADLLSGYSRGGDIRPAGLTGPRELRAVFGLSPGSADKLTPSQGYGGAGDSAPDESRVLIVLGIFLALLVLAPMAALVVVAAKLGEAERGDRGAVLRMLGAPQVLSGSVAAYECALVAVPAALIGGIAFTVLSAVHLNVPLVQVSAFPHTLRLPWWGATTIASCVVGLHCLIAARVTASGKRTVQPLLEIAAPRRWPLFVFGISVLLLASLAVVTALPPAVAGVAFFLAVGAVAATLAIALPALLRLIAGRSAALLAGAERYGARLIAARPLPSVRLAAITALLVVALGTALPFLTILKGGPQSLEAFSRTHPQTVVTAFGFADASTGLDTVPGVHASARLIGATATNDQGRRTGDVSVLVATCAQARSLLDLPLRRCAPTSGVWLVTDQTPISIRGTFLASNRSDVALPPKDAVQSGPEIPWDLSEVLVLDPGTAQRLVVDPGYSSQVFRVDTDRIDGLIARITALAPWADVRTGELEFSDPDQDLYPGTTQIIILAGTTSLALAALTLIAATLGEAAAQRRRTRPLLVLGAPRNQLLRLHATTAVAPIVASGTLATGMTWLIARALNTMDDRAVTPTPLYAALLAGVLALALLTFLISAPIATASSREPHVSD